MRRWCPGCSSIDPFPKRRRVIYALFVMLVLAALLAVAFLSPNAAYRRTSKIMAETKSFAAPPPSSSPRAR